jgi:hypothetical protein
MRRIVVAAIVIVAALVALPAFVPADYSHSATPSAGAAPAAPRPAALEPGRASPPTPEALRSTFLTNHTLPESGPLAGPVPNSARFETPPPAIPATTPVLQTFLSYSLSCCVEENFSVPNGTWETVVLNYTGLAVGGVYDTSYRAYLDGTLVLYGTTPEYGTWTVLQNLSQYRSLLHGTANLTFLLGGTTIGAFRTNLTISYYPLPPGGNPPPAPSEIVPLWLYQSVTSSGQQVSVTANVPSNVSQAVLQLYAFPYMSDEFFWAQASGANPTGLRVVEFGTNSSPLGAMVPFPFVQTGGIDFFLWRPISAVYTLNMPPYDLNLTGALGAVEGTHTFWADVQGVGVGAKWEIEASLLLWTNSSITGASPLSNAFAGPSTSNIGGVQHSAISYGASSRISAGLRSWDVNSTSTITFDDALVQPPSGLWQNYTESTNFHEATTTSSVLGNFTEDRSYGFGLSTDHGATFKETSSTGGGYPILGNFTSELLNTNQQWNTAVTDWGPTPAGPVITSEWTADDQLTDATGSYGGEESVASPTSLPVTLAYNFSTSATTKSYTQLTGIPGDEAVYSHLLSGSSYMPTMPYVAETVTADVVQNTPFPLVSTLTASPGELDLGSSVLFNAPVSGGVAPYSYLWSGLPAGCTAVNSSPITCTPSVPGAWAVGVAVRDSAGALSAPGRVELFVSPMLTASLVADPSAIDQGGNVSLYPMVSGGVAPIVCAWSMNGAVQNRSCSGPWKPPTSTPGTLAFRLAATDSTGATALSAVVNLTISPPLTVAVFLFPPAARVPAGTAVSVGAVATGGVGPIVYNWSLNGTPIMGAGGSNLTFVPPGAGTYVFSLVATDAGGGQSTGNSVTLTVTNPTATPVGSGAASSSGLPDWVAFAAVAAAVIELGLLAILLSTRRRNVGRPGLRPPPPRPPRAGAPPPP